MKKTLILIGITVVLLGGGILGSLYVMHHKQPEKIARIYQQDNLLYEIDLSTVKKSYTLTIDGENGAENVIRVKATVKNFREETNMSVITESGSFYTFNVKYAEEPLLLNIEMKDFIHDGSEVNRPNNALDIYLKELGSESPKLVYLISKSVHKNNKRHIKHIGSKAFGIQYLLRGLYTHNGLLYFHTQIRNRSNVPYEVDFVTFKIVDKKVMKRTAIQEQVIFPLRAYDYVTSVAGKKDGRTVFVLDKFTIPSDKVLVVEMHEKSGGRHQTFTVESEDIVRARVINGLKVK